MRLSLWHPMPFEFIQSFTSKSDQLLTKHQVNPLVCYSKQARHRQALTNNSDIVKVRLQTTTQYKSALDAATQIFKKEGPAAFYKGTLTPLIGIGACVSSPARFIDNALIHRRSLFNLVPTMKRVVAWKR